MPLLFPEDMPVPTNHLVPGISALGGSCSKLTINWVLCIMNELDLTQAHT